MIRIVTWNINSLRLRLASIKQLSEEYAPDIICLQETKVQNEFFPYDDLLCMGYEYIFINGQKSYNGVAILARLPLAYEAMQNWGGLPASRHICANLMLENNGSIRKIEIHNIYIPAGGDIADEEVNPKFAYKLSYLKDITTWFTEHRLPSEMMILLGDLNIAPYANDVWSHKQLSTVVSHTPIEIEALNKLKISLDWQDVARFFIPFEQKLYSWWSYRNRDWRLSDRGRRLDHIWVTAPLKSMVKNFFIIKDYRDLVLPSDHVPVVIDLDS